VPDGKRVSELERLRKPPRSDSGLAMTQALGRVDQVLSIGAGATQVQAVPANRIAALARYGMGAKAPHLARMPEPRKTATLLATARRLEAAAVDDALDLFDSLMAARLISPARRATDKARLAAMPRLEKASATLVAVARTVLELLDATTGPVDVAPASNGEPSGRSSQPHHPGLQRRFRRRHHRRAHPTRRAAAGSPRRRGPVGVPNGPPLGLANALALAAARRWAPGAGRLPDRVRDAVRDDRSPWVQEF
jgi:hypothetical protein